MKTDSTIIFDDDLLELISNIAKDDDLAFDARVQVQKYLRRCRQNIINDFEDFQWTDRNGGEPNSYFEEQYGNYIDKITDKYIV